MLVWCLLASVCQLVAASYPLYAKSRLSRSLAWPPMPVYYPPRATRPVYYPDSDYYYPQEPYYYPVDKPYVYQSVVPGYYLDQQRPYYYGYDEVAEPVDDLQDNISEEEDRGDYGQETWFQDSARTGDANADVNARFLQNLIIAQMYNDANKKYLGYPQREEEEGDRWVYGEPVQSSLKSSKEDEDVRELKSLVRGPERTDRPLDRTASERMERSDKKSRKAKDDIFAAQTKPNDWDEFRVSSYKRSNNELMTSGRKSKVATTAAPQAVAGQKEVILPRPAAPVRSPDFHQFNTRSAAREPSVYDTIKKLLHMEEQLDEDQSGSRLQKRSYIPSEESLVAQLGGLKKMA